MEDNDLIKLFDVNERRVIDNHDSLWQEEKHYTWISYILAGGLISIFLIVLQNQNTICNLMSTAAFIISLILSILGILTCSIGYKVIRREGEYYKISQEISRRILGELHNKKERDLSRLYPYDELPLMDVNDDIKKGWDCIRKNANKKIKILIKTKCEHGIRDWFQITMLAMSVLFIISLVLSIIIYISHFH